MNHRLPLLAALLATVVSLWVVASGLRISPDVADLLPATGDGVALRTYARAFGGGDLGMLLIRGEPAQVAQAAEESVQALSSSDVVRAVAHRISIELPDDPTLAWAYAGPIARSELARAVQGQGMRQRLASTRALLLSPGSASLAERVRIDPLGLRQIPLSPGIRVAPGAHAPSAGPVDATGALVASDGRARLVLIAAAGEALRGHHARAFVGGVQQALEPVRSRYPEVLFELTGGHAIAAATEHMLRRDLWLTGLLATVLAAAAFAVAFRRLRALAAVMPPLVLGTLWTIAMAGIAFDHLSAISLAFVSVVVGVGVDTGVHVYASLLKHRRAGVPAPQAARLARAETAKPTLTAATAAAVAFASLGLSQIEALRQFGYLCAAGELLTAAAILVVTPELGAWLEKGTPPAARKRRWPAAVARFSRWPSAGILTGLVFFLPVFVLATFGLPSTDNHVVAVQPSNLAPVRAQQRLYRLFGGDAGQWAVLFRAPQREEARSRADAMHERLELESSHVAAVDGLATMAPSVSLQKARLRERDALELPSRVPQLQRSLQEAGFALHRFEPALRAWAAPSTAVRDLLDGAPGLRVLERRYLARDGDYWVAALYVRPRPGHEHELEQLILGADPDASISGYARLEMVLKQTLAHDLPRIGAVALALVSIALLVSLRRVREVAIAWLVLVFEILWVLCLVQWGNIPLHAYNAFVIPVLLGITVDEAMFLLFAARADRGGDVEGALAHEGPNVLATTLATAAGFAALGVAQFDALRDMAMLGVVGVTAGLAAALLVVPVGLRWLLRAGAGSSPR